MYLGNDARDGGREAMDGWRVQDVATEGVREGCRVEGLKKMIMRVVQRVVQRTCQTISLGNDVLNLNRYLSHQATTRTTTTTTKEPLSYARLEHGRMIDFFINLSPLLHLKSGQGVSWETLWEGHRQVRLSHFTVAKSHDVHPTTGHS